MTDKEQIMIDGVDVKNCKGIDLSLSPLVKCKSLKFKTSDGGIAGIWCSDHTNCHFKQLIRKTQECEELKKQLIQKDEVNTFFNTPVEGWSSDPCNICECKNNYDRYRKALEEIEEVIKSPCAEDCVYYEPSRCYDCIKTSILDIISKAKERENE